MKPFLFAASLFASYAALSFLFPKENKPLVINGEGPTNILSHTTNLYPVKFYPLSGVSNVIIGVGSWSTNNNTIVIGSGISATRDFQLVIGSPGHLIRKNLDREEWATLNTNIVEFINEAFRLEKNK